MSDIDRLLSIMARLRDPAAGCAWDLEQSFQTIAPYTIEEAYEVAEAIALKDMNALKDELGDLLFQVVFHARMAQEDGCFDFSAVVAAICDKMIRRHPHIFGPQDPRSAEEQRQAWETLKAEERLSKGQSSLLDGITTTLPPMTRAIKLQARAATVGFDWNDPAAVFGKIDEELQELRAELASGASSERLTDEMGDVLFACINLARKLNINPDMALDGTNRKFIQRFSHIETVLSAQNRTLEQASLEEMERYWQDAKRPAKGG